MKTLINPVGADDFEVGMTVVSVTDDAYQGHWAAAEWTVTDVDGPRFKMRMTLRKAIETWWTYADVNAGGVRMWMQVRPDSSSDPVNLYIVEEVT